MMKWLGPGCLLIGRQFITPGQVISRSVISGSRLEELLVIKQISLVEELPGTSGFIPEIADSTGVPIMPVAVPAPVPAPVPQVKPNQFFRKAGPRR